MSISTEPSGAGGRRSVDSEINMVPMIDLLLCCICFLMLTAVWSTWARLETAAQLPGRGDEPTGPAPAQLHLSSPRADVFTLRWQQGQAVLRSLEVPRHAAEGGGARYPELAEALRREWAAEGQGKLTKAVLHVEHQVSFGEMAAIMDAVQAPRVTLGANRPSPAFVISLAD
jgi:biopolymer transport protein ExbD